MSTAIDYISPDNTATLNYKDSRTAHDYTTTVISPIEDIKQQFNGTVINFAKNELTVLLEDITVPSKFDEEMVVSIEDIDTNDRPLIKVGAMFYLTIGYRYGPTYPRERFTKISFRRLPKWLEYEIKEAKKTAKKYSNFFKQVPTKKI